MKIEDIEKFGYCYTISMQTEDYEHILREIGYIPKFRSFYYSLPADYQEMLLRFIGLMMFSTYAKTKDQDKNSIDSYERETKMLRNIIKEIYKMAGRQLDSYEKEEALERHYKDAIFNGECD